MLKFRTPIEISPPSFEIRYQNPLLMLGSCFAENIGQKLKALHYPLLVNPFGILYNPMSVRNALALLLNDYSFIENDLFEHNGLWHSFQHHSNFSNVDKLACLENINRQLQEAREHLAQTQFLALTFGTAWVYRLKDSHRVVSNCHKLPSNRFDRQRLTVEEIVKDLSGLLDYLKIRKPKLQVLLTVSPIRHLKDGFAENQLSKSTLIVAMHQLSEQLENVHYFPAYEIMMDDLRDYRFYEADMIHPNAVAIEYIWEQFERNYLAYDENAERRAVERLQRAVEHRALHPQSSSHQEFVQKQLLRIAQLQQEIPLADFSLAKTHFKNQLADDGINK